MERPKHTSFAHAGDFMAILRIRVCGHQQWPETTSHRSTSKFDHLNLNGIDPFRIFDLESGPTLPKIYQNWVHGKMKTRPTKIKSEIENWSDFLRECGLISSGHWAFQNLKNHLKNNDSWTSDMKNNTQISDFRTSDIKHHKNLDFWTSYIYIYKIHKKINIFEDHA